MSHTKLALVLRGLAVAGALVAMAAWMTTRNGLQERQKRIDSLEARISELQSDLEQAGDRITLLEIERNGLHEDLALSRQRLDSAQRQVLQDSTDISSLRAELGAARQLTSSLQDQARLLEAEILAVRSSPAPEFDYSREMDGYRERIFSLTEEIHELQSRLSLHPAPYSREATVSARVTALRPESGLLVLDQGSSAGLRAESKYAILKNGNQVGVIHVLAVEELLSVGSIFTQDGQPAGLQRDQSIELVPFD